MRWPVRHDYFGISVHGLLFEFGLQINVSLLVRLIGGGCLLVVIFSQ